MEMNASLCRCVHFGADAWGHQSSGLPEAEVTGILTRETV